MGTRRIRKKRNNTSTPIASVDAKTGAENAQEEISVKTYNTTGYGVDEEGNAIFQPNTIELTSKITGYEMPEYNEALNSYVLNEVTSTALIGPLYKSRVHPLLTTALDMPISTEIKNTSVDIPDYLYNIPEEEPEEPEVIEKPKEIVQPEIKKQNTIPSNLNLKNTINGIFDMVNSGIQAYNNVPSIKSANAYTGQLLLLGNSNYLLGSLLNLANLYLQKDIPKSLTGKDLYNPSAEERFGQLFSAGLQGFQSGYNASANSGLTSNMKEFTLANGGQLHKFAFGGGAMVDAAVGLGMAGINIGLNAAKNASNRKQAALDALRFNALRDFSIDRNILDFQRVTNDSTDNMFNMAALQMKANGGTLFTNGGEWSTGLNTIGNGGTHELNPLEGVPMGIAPDGIPNLVEENETIWKGDYVFSDRLKISKKMLDKYMLPSKYEGKSYAEVSKELSKESEERPNDPISKKGLEDSMAKLQLAQEEYKAIKDLLKIAHTAKNGGLIKNIFWSGGDYETRDDKYRDLTKTEWANMMYETYGPSEEDKPFIVSDSESNPKFTGEFPELDKQIKETSKAVYYLDEEGNIVATINKELPSSNLLDFNNLLRYAPTLIQGIQALKGNKVDYTNPNLIADNTRNINFTPLGDYMALERLPFVSTIGNKMQAQLAATNAAIQNVAANRAAAIPSLLTSSYQGQIALANAALDAAKYNNLLAETEANFNRGTNQANLTAGLDVEKANQQLAFDSAYKQAAMRELIDQYISESNSTNATTLLDNIQNIGREMDAIREAKKTMEALKAHGGKLNKRKKKGLTC